MMQFPNLTLKRMQRRNKKIAKRYPEDKKVHKVVEEGTVEKKELLGVIEKAVR